MTNAMLSSTYSETIAPSPTLFVVRAEFMAYALLLALALLLRIAMIDVVPLSEAEATRAYSAWHSLHPSSAGTPVLADSVMTFWSQRLAFVLLGGSEFSARLGGAVAGLLLSLLPLLFRARLGITRTFFLSLLLAFNPIALASSRTHDPALWTAVFVVVLAWAAWNLWENATFANAVWLGFGLAGVAFLSGGAGWVYLLVILLSLAALLWWSLFKAPIEWDMPATALIEKVRERWLAVAWRVVFFTVLATVFVVSTGVMLYPAGLAIVGEGLAKALTGWWQSANPTAPPLYPLWILTTYHLAFVLMGLVGFVFLARRGVTRTDDRLAVLLAGVGGLVLVVYQGATAGMTLWVALPLAWITAHWLTELLVDRANSLYWLITNDERRRYLSQHGWVKWLIGLVVLVLLSIMSFHWQAIGRGILTVNTPDYQILLERLVGEPFLASFRYSFIWFGVMLIFSVLLGLLASSVWGNDATWQGLGLGFFAFALISGVGGGWNATQAQAYPEIWDLATTHHDTRILRQTLYEVSMRETRGEPNLPLVAVLSDADGITAHGLVAWLLRDYQNAQFVAGVGDARREQIILLPKALAEGLDLGGSYVGQSFRLRSHYRIDALDSLRVMGWLSQRRTLREFFTHDDTVLWLRMDVYEGLSSAQR